MRRTLLALALSVPLLAGCGGSDATQSLEGSALDSLRAAAATTAKAGSSRISLVGDTKAAGQAFVLKGDGVFSYGATQEGELTMTGDVAGQSIRIAMRIVDGTAYLQLPQQPGWYSAPLDELAGTSFGSQSDPSQSLQYLVGASDDVKELGTEVVRGEKTTHYAGTIDVDKVLEKLTGKPKAAAEKAFATADITTLPYDAYLDSEGRMRKMVQKIAGEVQGEQLVSTTTIEFYDFGTKVDVTAPPAAEVKDGTSVLKSFG